MKKALIVILILLSGFLIFFGLRFYHNKSDLSGVLKVTFLPKTAVVTINGKVYKTQDGNLNIKLKPQEYSISFSHPGYSVVNKIITIKPQQTVDLDRVYLFPQVWTQDILIAGKDIINFYTNDDNNLIIYLTPIKNGYEWYLYNRNTKKSEKFYQSPVLPQTVMFTADTKKLIVALKENDWKLIFLPGNLIKQDIDLDSSFVESLKKMNLEVKPAPQIKQIVIIPRDPENKIIVRTLKGVYRFNPLDRSLEKIIDGLISPLVLEDNKIFFIKDNGILSSLNLSDLVENQLSFFAFKESEEDLNQIILKKLLGEDIFLVIKPKGWIYLLSPEHNPPLLLAENIVNANFSLTGNYLILYQANKGLIVYDIKKNIKIPLDILSDSLPQWFIDDNCFILLNDAKLKIYNFNTRETWLIADNLKEKRFVLDYALNYIFFLIPDGLVKTGL